MEQGGPRQLPGTGSPDLPVKGEPVWAAAGIRTFAFGHGVECPLLGRREGRREGELDLHLCPPPNGLICADRLDEKRRRPGDIGRFWS